MKINKGLLVLLQSGVLSIVYILVCFPVGALATEALGQLLNDKPIVKNLKFSPIFEGRGDGVHTCPVTGERVTVKTVFKADYFGRTVYFCCAGCLKSAQRNPGKYVKPTLAEQEAAVKATIARVPQAPSGEEYCNE